MTFPWKELGLAEAWIETSNGDICYDFESGHACDEPAANRTALHVRYTADDDAVGSDVLNLRVLARCLAPTLSNHDLTSVCAAYDVPMEGDGQVLTRLLRALLDDALRLDREVVAVLIQLLPKPWKAVLEGILVFPVAETVVEDEPESAPAAEGPAIESCGEALADEGPVAAAFASFEHRSGQLAMAQHVEDAFVNEQFALIEAGPGTGKTFAYLIPALLHLRRHASDRVVVSTRTKQLQEQLYAKDLPFLRERLAPNVNVALLKGRDNYLCLRRWHALIEELAESLERDSLLPLLAPLVRWMNDTKTGDIEENSAFLSNPQARGLWQRLADSPFHCTGEFCPFADTCFSVQARRRARRADLVVVNHSLLLGDLVVGGVILGKYAHLVVDEAHTLESVARMAFTKTLTERAVLRLADDLAPTGRRRGWLQRTPFTGDRAAARHVEELVRLLRSQTGKAFRQIARRLPEERRAAFTYLDDLTDEAGGIARLLQQIEGALDALADGIDGDEARRELEGYVRIVQDLKSVVGTLSRPATDNSVHWYERGTHALSCYATPLEVAPFLEEQLYPRLQTLIMTSATLSLAGSFDFLRRSVGLSDDGRIRTLIADSPFAYEDRMRIVVPRHLPPAHGELTPYAEALAALLSALSERTMRNGLALFTSYAMMQAVRDCLPRDASVFVQGEMSRTSLTERFRRALPPVWLFGTESFWEGVDFPGEELEMLVISRLPFPVPTDPVLAAMGRRLRQAGRDPFMDLSVPLAGLKLRQGIGRLIRTTQDHGMVVIADQRIVTRSYGRLLAAALPVPSESVAELDVLVSAAGSWFDDEPLRPS